jgi:membrane associated rhomboid family serine protease
MPPRYSSPYASSFSFGPGPLSSAMKALIGANVAVFFAQLLLSERMLTLGLQPSAVIHGFRIWQLVTYMFLHGGPFHILFNMLFLWMFGTELERTWGTRFFLKFYFVTGIGAAVLTVLFSLLPFTLSEQIYRAVTIGASGAIYGLLMAYGLYFPNRPIFMFPFPMPIPVKVFVLIMGGLAFYASLAGGGGVANATHLGGLLVGYVYLKGLRVNLRLHPMAEVKYRYVKWRMDRLRKKFDVHTGGRANDWDRRVH